MRYEGATWETLAAAQFQDGCHWHIACGDKTGQWLVTLHHLPLYKLMVILILHPAHSEPGRFMNSARGITYCGTNVITTE